MRTYLCFKCGQPIVFRAYFRHKDSKVIIRPHCARAIPIHIGGSCGQMIMPFLKSA
jgi:hypothetical protein